MYGKSSLNKRAVPVGIPQKGLKQVTDIQRNAPTMYITTSLCHNKHQSEVGMYKYIVLDASDLFQSSFVAFLLTSFFVHRAFSLLV